MGLYHFGLKLYVYFKVWHDEPSGNEGAVEERSASTSSKLWRIQRQKVSVGWVSGRGNYEFFLTLMK